MRPHYKNIIFETLKKTPYEIERYEFTTETREKECVDVITFKNTKLRFEIFTYPASYDALNVRYTTYGPAFPFNQIKNQVLTFTDVLLMLQDWINHHIAKYEHDFHTDDLWDAYEKSKNYIDFGNINYEDESYFTNEEIVKLKTGLVELKQKIILEFKITDEKKLNDISGKINYLVERIDKLPKRDWLGITISIIFSLIIALSVTQEQGKQLWDFLKKLLLFNYLIN